MSTRDLDKLASGIGVAEIRIDGDVEKELGLDKKPGAMRTLEFIADQGGEIGWNWEGGINPATKLWQPLAPRTRELVADLINMELLREREYVQAGASAKAKLTLYLTDKGRNVVAAHRQRKVRASGVRDVSVGELIEESKIH